VLRAKMLHTIPPRIRTRIDPTSGKWRRVEPEAAAAGSPTTAMVREPATVYPHPTTEDHGADLSTLIERLTPGSL
jgi:hypothetical protein